jgi:sulfoxide reductase heme-binding subunit YedZ
LIYLIAALGVFHFLWLVKRDVTTPDFFGTVLIVLLAARLIPARRRPLKTRVDQPSTTRLETAV